MSEIADLNELLVETVDTESGEDKEARVNDEEDCKAFSSPKHLVMISWTIRGLVVWRA